MELPAQGEPDGAEELLTLDRLCRLPIEERCALMLEHDFDGIELAIRLAVGRSPDAAMNAMRLAWAVAFNVGGAKDGPVDVRARESGSHRQGSGFRDRWPLELAWPRIWSLLIRPLAQRDGDLAATLLSELALSVACEQRDDWQDAGSRPLDLAAANRVFSAVHRENEKKVLGVCRMFASQDSDPEAIANEAWSRVFCHYWSVGASRRFHGLCRISTLVSKVARFIAIDEIRSRGRLSSLDGGGTEDAHFVPEPEAKPIDPSARLTSEQLNRRARECVSKLPAKRRIVAEMVWFRQMNARQVAQMLHVSEAAISQHLKAARETVGPCLEQHGFRVPA